MRRRTFLAAAGTGAALALAGCVTSGDESNRNADIAALQSVDADAGTGTVEATGSGTVEADPDHARLHVTVEETGQQAEDVRSRLSERAEAVRAALLDAGIGEDDVTTARFDIRDRHRGSGYEGTHAYRVEVGDVDAVGRIIDTAVDAGADDVGRIRFTLSEETRDELRNAALERAVDDARDDAETVAAANGAELLGVVSVRVGDGRVSPVRARYDVAMEADDAAATSIDEGPVTVSATVTVVYAFE